MKNSATSKKQLTILVSSTVYGIEELLDRIYTLLTTFGYEVWMSYKGTVPVFSNRSAMDNCLEATRKCDLFLGIITPRYGSGKESNGLSITHQELLLAIKEDKPRWLLTHDHVVFARSLLNNLGYKGKGGRAKLNLIEKKPILEDLRVIDMYEDATQHQIPINERQGNWVQEYGSTDDAALFATAQFSRYQEVESFLEENMKNIDRTVKAIKDKRDGQ